MHITWLTFILLHLIVEDRPLGIGERVTGPTAADSLPRYLTHKYGVQWLYLLATILIVFGSRTKPRANAILVSVAINILTTYTGELCAIEWPIKY